MIALNNFREPARCQRHVGGRAGHKRGEWEDTMIAGFAGPITLASTLPECCTHRHKPAIAEGFHRSEGHGA